MSNEEIVPPSGIYIRGVRNGKWGNVDLITEATVHEFKDWVQSKGMDILFLRDGWLDFVPNKWPLPSVYLFRLAILADLQDNTGFKVTYLIDEHDRFQEWLTRQL